MSANDLSVGTNFGEKLAAIPYGENGKQYSVLCGAIVSGKQIVKILPLKCIDNGDGTATLATHAV